MLSNLRKAILISLLLAFSFLIGEFVYANILVGTRDETIQVYLNTMSGESGHYISAFVISCFFAILLISLSANGLNRETKTPWVFFSYRI